MVESVMAIASHYSSLYDVDPALPWFTMEENIINLKWKGDISVSISLDLQNYLESSLDRDRGYELYTYIKNNDMTKIESLLQAIFMKPLGDRNIFMEIVSEVVSIKEIQKIRNERTRAKIKERIKPLQQTPVKEDNTVAVDLVLAPVSGIPIYELTKGDKIMVKISDKSVRGRYYIDFLGTRVEGNIIPIPAEVMDIRRNENNEYIILCKIKENIFGKAIETEQVKIKKYDELLAGNLSLKGISLEDGIQKRSEFPFLAIIAGGLMFVILVIFVIMWFYNII
ncbi:MAG: DUF4899 domain-containing protein [Spirochaetota bacterium]